MGPVVVDIETAGQFEKLAPPVQEYLVSREKQRLDQNGETDAAQAKVIEELALNPAAGTIVSIGMWLVNDEKGLVLVNNELDQKANPPEAYEFNDQTVVVYGTEQRILEVFWAKLLEKTGPGGRRARYPVVTFNGRMFDGPYLMLRSVIHGVKPSRNLAGYRYNLNDNCDLMEVLTLLGVLSWQHRYSLDFWCHQFGIASPKQDMDGSQVGQVWRSGDMERLIRYSISDIKATAQLYQRVVPLIETIME